MGSRALHSQQTAFEAERRYGAANRLDVLAEGTGVVLAWRVNSLPVGLNAVIAPIPGSVWKVDAAAGLIFEVRDLLVVLEWITWTGA